MKKSLFQISLLAMAFGLILSSSLTGVFGLEVSSAVNATTNNDSATRLIVDGLVNNTLTLSLDDLAAMPKSIVYAELYCYGLIVTSGNWGGVNLGLLLNMAGVDQQTASVEFHAQDGYSIALSSTQVMREDVIIAYEKDGQPLTEKLRLVVPGANGDIWISMITDLVIHGANGDIWISMITDLVDHGAKSDISISVPQPSQAPNQFPTPQSSPTPQPENQSVTSPVIPPSNSQPVQQHSSSGSSLPMEYGYLILSAIIVSAATGYLFYKRRK